MRTLLPRDQDAAEGGRRRSAEREMRGQNGLRRVAAMSKFITIRKTEVPFAQNCVNAHIGGGSGKQSPQKKDE